MKFAVISDLHIGMAARGKDLCPIPDANDKELLSRFNAKIEDKYQDNFVQFVTDTKITADYLVIPGDITNRAQPQEVSLASEFVLEAAEALEVQQDRILLAPGNHDVDWTVFDAADVTGVRWGQRYDPIKHPNFHFHNCFNQGVGDLFVDAHFIAWEFDDLVAIAYNSSSHDAPIHKDVAHHGLADPKHIDCLSGYLDKVDLGDKIKLFIVHHHLMNFSNPTRSTPEFSLMTNAEGMLNLLHQHRFDLIIHGHTHQPRFETHSTQTYPHLPVLCAGSFSAEIDTRLAGTIDNQFHLVEITGRAGTENRVIGTVTSWTNNHVRGWIPSDEYASGIHHSIPFGSYVMPRELDNRLEPFITDWFDNHEHILWSQILNHFSEYEHLPLNSAIAAFNRIAKRLNRNCMHQTLKDLIMY